MNSYAVVIIASILIVHLAWTSAQECTNSSDCPSDQRCVRRGGRGGTRLCVMSCTSETCGTNAQCEVRDHQPYCSCPPGYTGNPLESCTME